MNPIDIQNSTIAFARENRKRIAKELTDRAVYPQDLLPVSVFMAGSPGAGKTEFSKNFIMEIFRENLDRGVIRIDGDELRSLFPGYTGNNSYLFQGAVALIVEKVHDFVLAQKQSFILDGTFSNYEKAVQNVRRSLAKGRAVFIFYIYQNPKIAWEFTQKREEVEGRNIPKKEFIEHFLNAQETVNQIRKEFGVNVAIYLVKKEYKNMVQEIAKIEPHSQQVDEFVGERYTKNELHALL